MANLGAIQAEVLRIVEDHIDELTNPIVTHINRAQSSIEDRCAFKIQEAEVTYQVVPATTQYEQPSNFIAVRSDPYFLRTATSTGYTFLEERLEFETFGLSQATDIPMYWKETSDQSVVNFEFWPPGDDEGPSGTTSGAYDITFPYWARLETLVDSGDSNWWTERMDDVLAFKAAANVFAELRDGMANFWNSIAAARFIEIKQQMKRNRLRSLSTRITPAQSLGSRNRYPYSRQIITRIPS